MTLSEVQTVVAYAPLQNICAEHLVRLRDYDLIFEADPASGRHFLHDPLIDVTVSKMARRSITRPCFYIDDSRRFSLSTSVYRNTPNMALLLRNYQDFLSFLAHVALHKSGFDIVVSEFCGGDHFLAHILFFDPVDSKPQITLRNQGYSCRSAAIDGLHRGSVLDDHVLIGVFWLFRAFNVLKHCSCGIILPATSVRTETCECPNRENRNFKQFRLSQRQALDSYTAFTCCCGEANTTATLWQPESIIIHIPDRNFRLGEMQDSNDCAVYVIYGIRLLHSSQQLPTSERLTFLDLNLRKAAVRFSRSTLISNAMAGVPRDSCWSCQVRLAQMFKCTQGCMFFLCELCSWEQTSIVSGAPTKRRLTTQTFLRTIRPHTHVVSSTTSARCKLCTAAIDSSCAGQGLCKYCRLTTVEKQCTCCFCWSPMAPSPTALPGAPAAASESPTSPSPAAAPAPVDFVCKLLINGIIKSLPTHRFQGDLMKRQLQAIFPATRAHSVEEVAETALELWDISLADKADQPVSLKDFARNFGVLVNPVRILLPVDRDLLTQCFVHTCPV